MIIVYYWHPVLIQTLCVVVGRDPSTVLIQRRHTQRMRFKRLFRLRGFEYVILVVVTYLSPLFLAFLLIIIVTVR
jgi:hypothetical protein